VFAGLLVLTLALSAAMLLDLLHEVPSLLDFLAPHFGALLATNRKLRDLIHKAPANVILQDRDDIPVLASSRWSHVQGFTLEPLHETLYVSRIGDTYIPSIVIASWPFLKKLSLSGCRLNLDSVTTISRANWPLLECLELRRCFLGHHCVEELATANWPLMRKVDL